MIAAMSRNRVIGKDNQIPWHLPADLAHFKRTTLGKTVLMGRKTFESIGHPLPGRRNIVISRNSDYIADGIEVIASIDSLYDMTKNNEIDELFIIGGGHLYELFLPITNRLYLTKIDVDVDGDTYFPDFEHKDWTLLESKRHESDELNEYPYCFEFWRRY